MKYKQRFLKLKNNRGVTLLELIVSVSLFSVTMILAAQIFKMAIDGQREALISQNMQESIRYTFERMSKEIRMAQKDVEGVCVAKDKIYEVSGSKESVLTFLNYHDECVAYSLSANKRIQIQRIGIDPQPINITLGKIKIEDLEFKIKGDDLETDQLLVAVRISAYAEERGQFKHRMEIQTSISSRYYE